MARKASRRHNKRRAKVELELITNDQLARQEGPKRKTWSKHDLNAVRPLTPTQQEMFQCWFQGDNICAHGFAGTGKTFLAMYLAMTEMFQSKEYKKIIIVRSAVPTREIGFLKGSLEEKTEVYELPYQDICHELVGKRSTYQDMKDAGKIEFVTTSYIRGLTWDNAIIVVDEFQNMTHHEIDSIMTRVGENSRIILAGDATNQCDISKGAPSGASRLIEIADRMNKFATIEFSADDIVRSAFVKNWIIASSATA